MRPFLSKTSQFSLTSLLLLAGVTTTVLGLPDFSRPHVRGASAGQVAARSNHAHANSHPLDPRAMNSSNSETSGGSASGFRSVAYFVNWAIYGRKHRPQDIPAESLTHVLYSFADVKSDGTVFMTDDWADTDIHWEGDSWSDSGKNMYGCMKQLNLLKKKNRNLKVLLSVGGWTYSAHFPPMAGTDTGRATFVKSAVQLVKDYGFDGIDIDWEYPKDATEADNFVSLLKALREGLDAYGKTITPAYHFEMTVACPAGPTHFKTLKTAEMDKYLDFWNLMAYDYAGSWDQTSGHQANWNPSGGNGGGNSSATPFSTKAALDFYTGEGGVASNKMVIGMPLYGRAFEGTEGPGKPYTGVGKGDWEKGIYDFKNLPLDGSEEKIDEQLGASWSWNAGTKTMVSYDTKAMVQKKAELIKTGKLGGSMWWETSGDKKGDDSLIVTVVKAFGGENALQKMENCITYPESKYDNLKNGFSGSSGGNGTTGATGSSPAPSSTGGPGAQGTATAGAPGSTGTGGP